MDIRILININLLPLFPTTQPLYTQGVEIIQKNTNNFIGMKHKTMFLAKNDNTYQVSTNTKYKINREAHVA